nr:DUF4179 domain-containing protein [uncultured Peptoniphilus sp.]
MKDNLYDQLNNMKIKYEEVPLEDVERERLRETVKRLKYKNKRRLFARKIGATAAVLLLAFGVTNYASDGYVLAKTREITDNITLSLSSAMGLSADVDKYSVNISEPFEIDGKKYVLDKITTEDNNLYAVILSFNGSGKMSSKGAHLTELKVNGKEVEVLGSSGQEGNLPGNPNVNVISLKYSLNNPLPKEGTAQLEFTFNELLGNNKKISIATRVDMGKMKMEKRIIAKDFAVPNSNGIMIKEFAMSPASQKMILTYPPSANDTIFSVKARDSKGRLVYFETIEASKNTSTLYFSPVISEVTVDELLDDITSLKCQLYRSKIADHSGKESHGEQAMGSEFSLDLN